MASSAMKNMAILRLISKIGLLRPRSGWFLSAVLKPRRFDRPMAVQTNGPVSFREARSHWQFAVRGLSCTGVSLLESRETSGASRCSRDVDHSFLKSDSSF